MGFTGSKLPNDSSLFSLLCFILLILYFENQCLPISFLNFSSSSLIPLHISFSILITLIPEFCLLQPCYNLTPIPLNPRKSVVILRFYLSWDFIFLQSFTGDIFKTMWCVLSIVTFYIWRYLFYSILSWNRLIWGVFLRPPRF